jgi:hypothetical protein
MIFKGKKVVVVSCSRSDCENIMCSKYSEIFGYICQECYTELQNRLKGSPELNLSDIENWLNISKQNEDFRQSMIDVDKLFTDIKEKNVHNSNS